ncbi:MAG TPA: hypothetical protein VFR51_11360 [Pyrinomonadaceae bacterium]|nr:hypothetical protein [Pyrinomonadaceae bacterium]HEU4836517.1 hypothetical protein [Pyrinomonadaceae bacterium]
MKRFFSLFLLVAACCGSTLAQDKSIDDLRRMFDYDQNAPLDIKEVSVISRNYDSIVACLLTGCCGGSTQQPVERRLRIARQLQTGSANARDFVHGRNLYSVTSWTV